MDGNGQCLNCGADGIMKMGRKKESCPTCGHPLNEYKFNFSYLDALLLMAMGCRIRSTKKDHPYAPFVAINKIHLPSLDIPSNVSKRMTITSKLGLIAKVKIDGKQDRGMWLITARGWAALRGESVPSHVSVFRGEITERTNETITILDALKTYPDSDYNPKDWYEFGEIKVEVPSQQLL